MATTYKTAGIALLIVSVLGVAALGGVVYYKSEADENPNDILGIYTLYKYTQGGVGKDGEWHWYETGDGTYDGEKIIISEYKDGFVKGYGYVKGDKFEISGFYDPVKTTFGYASCYDYTPGSSDKVVDMLFGYIDDGTMVLTGVTVSATAADQAFTYRFIFVKDGRIPEYDEPKDIKFDSPLDSSYVFENDAKTGKETISEDKVIYTPLEYKDGVYKIYNGKGYVSATIVMQNDSSTLFRTAFIEKGKLSVGWMILSNDSEDRDGFSVYSDSWDDCKSTTIDFYHTTVTVISLGTFTAVMKIFNPKDCSIDRTTHTVRHEDPDWLSYSFRSTNKTMEKLHIVNELSEFKFLSHTLNVVIDGKEYYGDFIGLMDLYPDLDHYYGFLIAADGEVLVVNEVMSKNK